MKRHGDTPCISVMKRIGIVGLFSPALVPINSPTVSDRFFYAFGLQLLLMDTDG
jgi:hypothetical protein